MKKHWIPAAALLLTAVLLSGCRRNTVPMVTAETTVPLNTVRPTTPTTEPTETRRPAVTVPDTAPTLMPTLPETTIEDGNGPIPSQTENHKF